MTATRFKTRLQRLEQGVPAPKAWTPPATLDEAQRQIDQLVERIRARKAQIEADLASGDRKRVAAARRQIAEIEAYHASAEAQNLRAEIEARRARLIARGVRVPHVPPEIRHGWPKSRSESDRDGDHR
jgi:hypothetical protein